MSCSICCQKLTAVKRRPVTCPSCHNEDTCLECVKRYLTTDQPPTPGCMHCKSEWPPIFLALTLPAAFRRGPLHDAKLHRELQEQRRLLPGDEPRAAAWHAADKIEEEARALQAEAAALEDRAADLRETADAMWDRARHVRHGDQVVQGEGTGIKLGRCALPGCKGSLDAEGVCCVCSQCHCTTCLEAYGDGAREGHTCNPSKVATIKLLRETARPCPGCGAQVAKVRDGGCDQMWCTQCHTTFSWATGRAQVGARIHNPHYIEHLRANGGAPARAPGDIPGGALCTARALMRSIKGLPREQCLVIRNCWELARRAAQRVETWATYLVDDGADRAQRARVAYLVGRATEEEMSQDCLAARETHERETQVHARLATFAGGTAKILRAAMPLLATSPQAAEAAVGQLRTLRRDISSELATISITWDKSSPQLAWEDGAPRAWIAPARVTSKHPLYKACVAKAQAELEGRHV